MTTDHVKIWLNNSQYIGLVVKPFTYRVNFSPTFFPRFSVGDMSGIDQARWRSWVQSRFDEGEGQLLWSSALATNRYAGGHLVEVGRPLAVKGGNSALTYMWGSTPNNMGSAGNREDSVVGDIAASLYPRVMSIDIVTAKHMATRFTDIYPTFVVEWSTRPSIWHWKTAWIYTSVQDTLAWSEGAVESYASKLTGKWVPLWQHSMIHSVNAPLYISDVIPMQSLDCSNFMAPQLHVVFQGMQRSSNNYMTYGPVTYTSNPEAVVPLQPTAATARFPVYGTTSAKLAVYDDKLWRAVGGVVYAMNNPVLDTIKSDWWTPHYLGDRGEPVLGMKEFNGRLYFGKPDALWTYDGGRMYKVEDFSSYSDNWNFSHMTVHRGFLYFNIKHMMYRLSTAGTLEQLQTYPRGGVIVAAASVGDKLYYVARNPGFHPSTDVWVFDPESGGNTRLFNSNSMSHPNWGSLRSIGSAYGLMMMSPMSHSFIYIANKTLWSGGQHPHAPVMAMDVVTPPMQVQYPRFAGGGPLERSWLTTSMLDFGVPTLMKAFRSVTVDYELYHQSADVIDVYYILELKQHQPLLSSFEAMYNPPEGPGSDPDTSLLDGEMDTGRTFLYGPDINTHPNPHYSMWTVGVKVNEQLDYRQTHAREDITRFRFVAKWNPSPTLDWKSPDGRLDGPSNVNVTLWRWDAGVGYPDGDWYPVQTPVEIKKSLIPGQGDAVQFWVVDAEIHNPEHNRLIPAYTSQVTYGAYRDSLGLQDWYALKTTTDLSAEDFQAREVVVPGAWSPTPVEGQKWNFLGRIGGSSDMLWSEITNSRKELMFPKGTISEQIMLKFVFNGSKLTRAGIRRYEIDWMPAPSRLRTYNFTIPVAENIELPNLEVRSNAMSLVATVFSLIGAGRPYVCQLPWPGTHTLSAIITMNAPGGVVPSLRDDNPDGSYSEMPIQLDEM